jgi:hypothetical protein
MAKEELVNTSGEVSHGNWSCYANKPSSKYVKDNTFLKIWITQIIKKTCIAWPVVMASFATGKYCILYVQDLIQNGLLHTRFVWMKCCK